MAIEIAKPWDSPAEFRQLPGPGEGKETELAENEFNRFSVRSVAIGTAPVIAVEENRSRKYLLIRNTGGTIVYIGSDADPTTLTGFPLDAGTGFIEFSNVNRYVGPVKAVVAAGTGSLLVMEG